MCPALTRGVTSLCGQQVEWLSNTGASRWHEETLGRSALCFKSPSVCCIMGLFTSACVSHLPLLNPGQSPSRFPRVAGAQAATPLHIFISSAVPLRLIFFIFLALHLSVVFSRSDIDFHFLSPRPLPLTAHQ